MLKKVTAYSGSYQCVLDMSASESDGALIFDITGIAEDSREITVDKLASRTVISAVAPTQRVIVISIRITDTDVETRRRSLTNVFKAGNSVRLVFETDLILAREISGVVESCNNPVFSKESTMVVTIVCPQSVFTSVLQTQYIVAGTTGSFTNLGDTSCGCTMLLQFAGGSPTTGLLSVTNISNGTLMKLNIAKIISMGGSFGIDKYIKLKTGITKTCMWESTLSKHNIFATVDLPYTWIQIDPGANDIRITGVTNPISVIGEVSFTPSYGGL